MSTNEGTSEQEGESVESADQVAGAENLTLDVSEDFTLVLKSLFEIKMQGGISDEERMKKIERIISKTDSLFRNTTASGDPKTDEIVVLAHAYLLLSRVDMYKEEEDVDWIISLLTKSTNLLKGKEQDPKCILTALEVYHDLGASHDALLDVELSLCAYNQAFQLYLIYTKEEESYSTPLYIPSYLHYENLQATEFLHKITLLVIVNILTEITEPKPHLMTNPEHIEKILTCQHKILKKKLNNSSDVMLLDWGRTAAWSSKYFVMHAHFTVARDYLAFASLMAKKFYEGVYMKTDIKKYPSRKTYMYQNYRTVTTQISKCWANYGMQLLRLSHKRILCGAKDNLCAACNAKSPSEEGSDKLLLLFSNVNNDIKKFTDRITDKYILSYADASTVFEIVMNYLNEMKTYRNLERDPMLYVMLILRISQAHKYFALYVSRIERQKLHKQRLEILSATLELAKLKGYLHVRVLLIETIIATNDTINAMHENVGSQWNQFNKSALSSSANMLTEINEMARYAVKLCHLWSTYSK